MVKIKLRGTLLVFLKSLEFQNGMALYINNIDVCVVSFMRLALAVSTKPLFEPIRGELGRLLTNRRASRIETQQVVCLYTVPYHLEVPDIT